MKSTLLIKCDCGKSFRLFVGDATRIPFGKLPEAVAEYMNHLCQEKNE